MLAERYFIYSSLPPRPPAARIAAADDLAEDGQVRGDAKVALGAAGTDKEGGDHLVKYQQCTIFVAETAHAFVKVLIQGAGAFQPQVHRLY